VQGFSCYEKVINAQFSQTNEKEADDCGLKTLRDSHRKPNVAVSALKKLGDGEAEGASAFTGLTSTHPKPAAWAERMRKMIRGS